MVNRLNNVPKISRRRTMFDLSSNVISTFNAGELIPIGEPVEVLPGDTFRLGLKSLVRAQTFIKAPMQNLDLDVYAFYVRDKDVWDHFENFMGQNDEGEWTEGQTEYNMPALTFPEGGFDQHSIANYFGIPIKVYSDEKINHLPFRGYAHICNNWFRNQNVQKPCYMSKGDAEVAGSNGDNYITDVIKGGKPFPVTKKADRFTRALPEAQKGPSAVLPLGSSAPVIGNGTTLGLTDGTHTAGFAINGAEFLTRTNLYGKSVGTAGSGSSTISNNVGIGVSTDALNSGLIADLSNASPADINLVRQTFQIQKYMERDALYGTRYREFLLGHFSVLAPEANLDIPQYLGGRTIPINITPITQTSGSTNDGTPQGNVAGMSVTVDSTDFGTHSFTEHGFIFFLCCVRVHQHSYQQGLSKMWSYKTKYDLFDPLFENLGNQAIKRKELYLTNDATSNDTVFGYQEYGAHLRYNLDIVSGELRDNADGSQSVWGFTDYYESAPILSADWIKEDKSVIDKTLTVTSDAADQFIGNFRVIKHAARIMSEYSLPGLIDHH